MMGLHSFDRATSKQVDSSAKQKPQGWGFLAVDAKKVNAKANTTMGAVKVTKARGFRFGGTTAVAKEAAFA